MYTTANLEVALPFIAAPQTKFIVHKRASMKARFFHTPLTHHLKLTESSAAAVGTARTAFESVLRDPCEDVQRHTEANAATSSFLQDQLHPEQQQKHGFSSDAPLMCELASAPLM